jgi:oxygen-independent coproporphyrinogen-3 oxidase
VSDRLLAGLYLHVPFCARICPYCDFAVRTGDRSRRRRFVDHLLAEIELYADFSLCFDTVYFGGGTPSLLGMEDLERILDRVRRHLRLADRTWVFLEANPEDVTADAATSWRRMGVDTLSLGVQSLDPAGLSFLGRSHGVDDARDAVALARAAGFHTVSIDLIYGLPGQEAAGWRRELDRALQLEPQHISCYQLTVHSGTRFGRLEKRGGLTQLSIDAQATLFELAHRHLNAAGLQGYEVSQFAASPEHRSRHNLKYWNHTPYLGLGPAAHSFLDGRRWWNVRRTDPWQDRVREGRRPIEGAETLDAGDMVLESLMMGMRTYAGVDLGRLRSRWGVDLIESNLALVERLESEGLVALERDHLVPTLDGLAVADAITSSFDVLAPSNVQAI